MARLLETHGVAGLTDLLLTLADRPRPLGLVKHSQDAIRVWIDENAAASDDGSPLSSWARLELHIARHDLSWHNGAGTTGAGPRFRASPVGCSDCGARSHRRGG